MTETVVKVDPWLEKLVSTSPAIAALREFFGAEELVEVGAMAPPPPGNDRATKARGIAGSHIASWAAPNPHDKPPTHVIWVMQDAGVFQKHLPTRARLVETGLRHESWHARETDRDAGLMQMVADYYHIPAALYNVFEDARIEDIARWAEYWDFGYFAGPRALYKHDHVGDVKEPLDLFQYMVMCEGYVEHERKAAAKFTGASLTTWRGKRYHTPDLVAWFVHRAQRAASTRALWPVMLEFIEAFPEYTWTEPDDADGTNHQRNVVEEKCAKPDPDSKLGDKAPGRSPGSTKGTDESKEKGERGKGEGEGEGEGEGDGEGEGEGEGEGKDGKPPKRVAYGYGGLWNPDAKHKADSLARQQAAKMVLTEELKKGPVTEKTEVAHGLKPFVFTHDSVSTGNNREWKVDDRRQAAYMAHNAPDLTDAPAIAQAIRRMVGATDSSRVRTSVTGTHLHMTTVMTGASDAFRRTITRKGRRRVAVVMDMSGSMGATFQTEGGAFIEAMLILQRQGVFEVDVILSGGGQRYRLPRDTKTDTVLQMHADHGCESIMATLEAEKATVLRADTVLVYTDGHLTDGDIDTKKWRSRGVDLIGVMSTAAHSRSGAHHRAHADKAAKNMSMADANKKFDEARAGAKNVVVQFQDTMNKHFHKAIVAETGRELAMRIAQYVLAREK